MSADTCEYCECMGKLEMCLKTGCPTVSCWLVRELLKKIKELEK